MPGEMVQFGAVMHWNERAGIRQHDRDRDIAGTTTQVAMSELGHFRKSEYAPRSFAFPSTADNAA
jgi:hypothetical protein